MISDWQSSIARADLADWVTVAAYLLAALASARAARHASQGRKARDAVFWWIATVLLVLLAINELLDLQTHLTELGRAFAKENGWYGERRRVQYMFVLGLGVAAVFTGLAMLWLTKRTHAAMRLALVGFVFIGTFALIRAASFHNLGELLSGGAPEFTWGSLQELAGILIVAAGAALYARKPRSGVRRR